MNACWIGPVFLTTLHKEKAEMILPLSFKCLSARSLILYDVSFIYVFNVEWSWAWKWITGKSHSYFLQLWKQELRCQLLVPKCAMKFHTSMCVLCGVWYLFVLKPSKSHNDAESISHPLSPRQALFNWNLSLLVWFIGSMGSKECLVWFANSKYLKLNQSYESSFIWSFFHVKTLKLKPSFLTFSVALPVDSGGDIQGQCCKWHAVCLGCVVSSVGKCLGSCRIASVWMPFRMP